MRKGNSGNPSKDTPEMRTLLYQEQFLHPLNKDNAIIRTPFSPREQFLHAKKQGHLSNKDTLLHTTSALITRGYPLYYTCPGLPGVTHCIIPVLHVTQSQEHAQTLRQSSYTSTQTVLPSRHPPPPAFPATHRHSEVTRQPSLCFC